VLNIQVTDTDKQVVSIVLLLQRNPCKRTSFFYM